LVRTATIAIECASRASSPVVAGVEETDPGGELRGDVDNLLAVFEESLRPWPNGAVAALDRPHSVGPGLDVLAHRGVAGLVGGEPSRAKPLLVIVDDLDGGRQLVGIDPADDVHHVLLPPVLVPDVDGEVDIATTSRAVPS
jgi:hypothetical protein